jgi:hypothetical protein
MTKHERAKQAFLNYVICEREIVIIIYTFKKCLSSFTSHSEWTIFV